MAERHVFISEARIVDIPCGDYGAFGTETWRVIGVPKSVSTCKRWRVTLEEVPSDTPFGEVKE